MLPFPLFCAAAVICMVAPTCMEKLGLGFRVILTGLDETPRGLLPPHAGKNKEMATTTHNDRPKRNLPMHPLVASRLYPMGARHSMEWKTCSLENEDGFSKLARPASFRRKRKGCMTGSPRLRQWDAKRWVDDVSMELL
jgi:hypothetical protein